MRNRNVHPLSEKLQGGMARLTVSEMIFDHLLEAIYGGVLAPGDPLSDIDLAAELGVSRTPVREALQRLRSIGLVEAEPYRFTRVAVITPRRVQQHLVVWVALMGALIEEVITIVPRAVLRKMRAYHRNYQRLLEELERIGSTGDRVDERISKSREIARVNFDFFTSLTGLSNNKPLRSSLESTQHVIRLGSLTLPDWLDVETISESQSELLSAMESHDVARAHRSIQALKGVSVPGAAEIN